MRRSIITVSAFAASVLGCAQHDNYHYPGARNKKRADAGVKRDWEYATSYDWGSISAGTHHTNQHAIVPLLTRCRL